MQRHSRAMLALVSLVTATPSPVQGQECVLPETFNPYFQAALNDVESTLSNQVVGELDDIGLGPISQLSVNNLINFKENIFDQLFGNTSERNGWINVTSDVDVRAQLEANLDAVVGSTPPELSMTCVLETTEDLVDGEPPYRFAIEFALSGNLLGTDLDLASLSPEIAVLPETSFDPLSLSLETLTADYEMKLLLTIDTKRRKFSIGEIAVALDAALSTTVLQDIQLADTVDQSFQGSLAVDVSLSYSTVKDWVYTASFEASLTAETSAGTAVASLGLIASDDDVFDDKPRE